MCNNNNLYTETDESKNVPIIIEFEHSPIPTGCMRRLDEIQVKRDGCIWRIHPNDPDPFPSIPHARNIESGLKMHLGTGELYLKTKYTGKKVSKKDLVFIRDEAQEKGITLPLLPTNSQSSSDNQENPIGTNNKD